MADEKIERHRMRPRKIDPITTWNWLRLNQQTQCCRGNNDERERRIDAEETPDHEAPKLSVGWIFECLGQSKAAENKKDTNRCVPGEDQAQWTQTDPQRDIGQPAGAGDGIAQK